MVTEYWVGNWMRQEATEMEWREKPATEMKKAPVIRTPFLRKPKLKLKDSKKSQLINSHGNFNFR